MDCMFDFAPMEGVTDYSLRETHSARFPGVDRYYSPFIAANQTRSFKTREKQDVAPEHNSGVVLVPQILTNHPEVFLWAAGQMLLRGWGTVNLNLGCPSAMVVTHGKGAGFLSDPDRLDAFFERVFDGAEKGACGGPVRISVKTRIGVENTAEAASLLTVFSRYPLDELIVHPRLRKDFYQGVPDLDIFEMFYEDYRGRLTYNGDIRSPEDLKRILDRFPKLGRVMIGRGLIVNPALVRELQGGPALTMHELQAFHDELLVRRVEALQGFHNASGKMKELWYYFGELFPDREKEIRKIKKARSLMEYRAAAAAFFGDARG